jgi:glycosyltransferase involved in cell wall biosynthesis
MIEVNKNWKFELSPPPPVTAYTTTYNCINGGYPVVKSILSWRWCDKIVVVDGGSTDGTLDLLRELQKTLGDQLVIHDVPIDLETPGKDGMQKSMAFAMVDTPLAIQFDIDEICIGSHSEWKKILKNLDPRCDILSLPVIEPIGSLNNLRVNKGHTPWKWRIVRTKPEIMHGIPKHDQLMVEGRKHSRGGSDGCFYVHVITDEMYPFDLNNTAKKMVELFVKATNQKEKISEHALAYSEYVASQLSSGSPMVLHLGHVDLRSKLRHYLSSWHSWWCLLFDKDPNDPENNQYFTGVPVDWVTEQMIEEKVEEILEKTPSVFLDVEKYL